MNFLHDFTSFVIDIHQIMLISLFPFHHLTTFTFICLADSYYGMILDCDIVDWGRNVAVMAAEDSGGLNREMVEA